MCNEKLGGRGVNGIDDACICRIFPTDRSPLLMTPCIGRPNVEMGINFEYRLRLRSPLTATCVWSTFYLSAAILACIGACGS